MPIYSFRCLDCKETTEQFILHTDYQGQQELDFPGVECDSCHSPSVERDSVADMRTQYTERAQYFDDTTPDEVAGRGGFSRERKRILKDAKLVEKGDLPKRPRPVTYRITESEIRARLDSGS